MSGIQFFDVQVLRIFDDVVNGWCCACCIVQSDQVNGLQQQQSASAVGYVIRDSDRIAVLNFTVICIFVRVDPQWRHKSESDWCQVCVVVCVVVFQESYVLEGVQVEFAVVQSDVRLVVISEFDDFKVDVLIFQTLCDSFPDFDCGFADQTDFDCSWFC